jgi:hypothetical protein
MLLGVRNPLLRPHLQVLGDHFGGEGEGAFAVQRVDLAGGGAKEKSAVLVSRLSGTDPILLVLDGERLAWSNPFPTTGTADGMAHLALAPRPDAGIAMFGYVPAAHTLMARMWSEDGTPEADIQLGSFEACDDLSATYGAPFGWIVACASPSGTRAQLLGEDRKTAWADHGRVIGEATAVGPATIVFDTWSTWVLVQRARRSDADHLLAFRYDVQGQPLWATPADVGIPVGLSRREPIEASAVRDGVVRVDLPQGLREKRASAAEIGPDGTPRLL